MQAARGTPLNDGDDDTPDVREESATARRPPYRLFVGIALVAYLLDLGTKTLALRELEGRAPVPVVGDLLRLTLVFNPGAAFSLGTGATVLLSLFAIAAAVTVLVVARNLGDRLWAVGFGFLLGGILGNLTDRLFRSPGPLRGHVVDFLQLPNWPVFNVADMCINAAAVIIVIQAFRGISLRGERTGRGAEEQTR